MLKQRIITAAFLIPLVIWSIYSLSSQSFTYVMAVVLFLATLEWNNFVAYSNKMMGLIFSVVTTVVFLYLNDIANTLFYNVIIYIALSWWVLTLLLLNRFPFASTHPLHKKTFKVIIGFIMLLSTFIALNLLRNTAAYGPDYVMYLLLIIWFADSGAYFTGRALGKHKLIVNVSPGKTWEGVAGAIAVSLVVAIIAVNLLNVTSSHSIMFILLSLITIAFSVIGDLTESMFKRMANLKDSGKLLPGHGGILDRIDSLTAALPVFLAGLWLMETLA